MAVLLYRTCRMLHARSPGGKRQFSSAMSLCWQGYHVARFAADLRDFLSEVDLQASYSIS